MKGFGRSKWRYRLMLFGLYVFYLTHKATCHFEKLNLCVTVVQANFINSFLFNRIGERPFACDHPNCGKTFTRNEELTRHKRIHSGLRPFSCSVCGKRFGRKDHLKKHVKTHQRAAAVPLMAHIPLAASAMPYHYLNAVNSWITPMWYFSNTIIICVCKEILNDVKSLIFLNIPICTNTTIRYVPNHTFNFPMHNFIHIRQKLHFVNKFCMCSIYFHADISSKSILLIKIVYFAYNEILMKILPMLLKRSR